MKADDILDALAERQFERLIENPKVNARLRKRLGNFIDMWAYQERVIGVLALSKSMGPVLAEAGKKVGRALSTKSLSMIQKLPNYQSINKSSTLQEAQRSTEWSIVQAMYQMTGTGIINMVRYEKGKLLIFQVEECVSCTGLPNLGESVCYYLGGQLAGAMEVVIGKNVGFVESLCQAKGDSYCEFRCSIS
ncbi:MAG: V4R domain-containing protein [Promethearchaeati archaeon SRVP18_Atabeyarchaeia-1]